MQLEKKIGVLIFYILVTVARQGNGQQPGSAVFQFSLPTVNVSEDSGTIEVEVEKIGDVNVAAALRVTTTDISATANVDYSTSESTVQFFPGDTTKRYSVRIIDDEDIEGAETFQLSLSIMGPARPSAQLGAISNFMITILESDQPPATTSAPTTASVSGQDNGDITREHGGNITLNTTAKMDVVCHTDYIEVTLERADYPGLIVTNESYPHLEDMGCVPGFTDENVIRFTFGLEACKTEQEDDGENIIYKNKVFLFLNQSTDNPAITREHQEEIPFKCSYGKEKTISRVSYSPRSTKIITQDAKYGNFTYSMDMYEDADHSEKVEEYPKVAGLGQRLYFGFHVQSGDSKLLVFPDTCKATLSSDYDATPDHLIIENACSRDNTLEYAYNQSASQYFSFAAFRFKDGYDDVFIHCKLTVCREDDTGSRCIRGCEGESSRKRRSTEDDMSANLYVGPVKFSDRQQKKTVTIDGKESGGHQYTEESNSMVVIVAVLVGVLGAVAIALIVGLVVVAKGRRRPSGEKLVFAEEM